MHVTCRCNMCIVNRPVLVQRSLLYLTGASGRFSNSNAESYGKYGNRNHIIMQLKYQVYTIVSSLPCDFLKALVQRTLRGFLFLLNDLWHFERQNLKFFEDQGTITTIMSTYLAISCVCGPTLQSFLTNMIP